MVKCKGCKKELKSWNTKYQHKKKGPFCYECQNKNIAEEKRIKKHKKEIENKKAMVEYEKQKLKRRYIMNKMGTITKIVKNYNPRGLKTHQQWKMKIKKHLLELFPDDILISTEHGLGTSRLDIAVGRRKVRDVAIEIKRNLNSGKFDRTKGQIHTYVKENFRNIIIVLIGNTDETTKRELKQYSKEIYKFYNVPVEIIEK